jgi:hypothetical protein
VVVRLQSGALAVFSPVALTDDVKQKVAEMGEVKYITALDIEVRLITPSSSAVTKQYYSTTSSSAPGIKPTPMPKSLAPKVSPRSASPRTTKP